MFHDNESIFSYFMNTNSISCVNLVLSFMTAVKAYSLVTGVEWELYNILSSTSITSLSVTYMERQSM